MYIKDTRNYYVTFLKNIGDRVKVEMTVTSNWNIVGGWRE